MNPDRIGRWSGNARRRPRPAIFGRGNVACDPHAFDRCQVTGLDVHGDFLSVGVVSKMWLGGGRQSTRAIP